MNEAAGSAKRTRDAKARASWEELNERQRAYLSAVYRQDRNEEAHQRNAWSRGHTAAPASVWRWILYGSPLVDATPLRASLAEEGLVDEGTGSTFAALEERGLLETRKGSIAVTIAGRTGHVEVLYAKMTTKGRAAARAGADEPPPEGCLPGETRLPTGTLKERHWRALAKAYAAGKDGVDCYGAGVGWRTWERLIGYRALGYGPLVRMHDVWRHGRTEEVAFLSTDGKRFYEERREEYLARYPDVEAILPGRMRGNP